ncbi:C4-dicarboxylate ABC transporter permease [Marinomonas piezotolerans]|uniref:TRAP transporter large permease protein n=1 Tax=Marinomonas piezotolerans TaxID=2213058 RepID=A0A370UE32_9GAMM|nr:TRAP transporter large permease [Marinomonas piezotolerans]RDL45965.1 C4-dicarboxylate ABC transporter permease [Marinomonas piezotolerans]
MLGFAILLFLLIIGSPIAFAVLLAVVGHVSTLPFNVSLVAQRIFAGLDSFSILAIPLFVLAGELMNESGITGRIINFANALVGHMRAGLAQVNIWASVIFAGLSGSAVADTSALGRVFIPTMEKEGYPRSFAAALTASSSVIGPMIPPSIPVIIYALITSGVSVPALFLAGVAPGIFLAFGLSIYVYFYAGHYAPLKEKLSMKERLKAFFDAWVPLFMPVFIVGSILTGIVTPTEAAAFAAAYALIAGMTILKSLKVSQLPSIFVRAMRDSSVILIVIAVISAANWLLTFSRVPQTVSAMVLEQVSSPWMFLLLVNGILLVVGLFLEGIAAMLILLPILHPIAMSLGIDPVHFGIVVIFNLMIGLVTPPMGICLFVSNSIANVGIAAISRQIMPMFLVELAVLMLITFVPATVTFLPRLFGY